MTDQQPENQAKKARIWLAAAILLVCVSMMLTTYVYRLNPNRMWGLGMLELPWITVQGIRWIEAMKAYWFFIVPNFMAAAFLAWQGALGRPRKGVIAALYIVALAIPCIGYIALEKPLVEFERKLHPATHGAGGSITVPRGSCSTASATCS